MSPRTRLILIFAGKAVGIIIAVSVLWNFLIAMPYNRALVAVSDSLSSGRIILGEDATQDFRQLFFSTYGVPMEDDYLCVATPREDFVPFFMPLSALHYGMLLVVSLIAATPALGWRRRLMFIPIAILIMFLIHVSTILIIAKVSLSGANPLPTITLFITLGTALFPTLVWGILCYKYWWPKAV
ncbi:MAG: hypothetical protein WB564_06680 [Dehalococcoidia bacterium]